jgi:hypothetical protein
MPLPQWTIGRRYKRRWGPYEAKDPGAEYCGIVANFPENFPKEGMPFCDLKDHELSCPVFKHRDLKHRSGGHDFFIHNLDGSMKPDDHQNLSFDDLVTLHCYDVIGYD